MEPDWYKRAKQVQGWFDQHELAPIIEAASGATPDSLFVEIGVWKGHATVAIVPEFKGRRYVAVDHFGGSDETPHLEDPDLPRLREVFEQNLEKFGLGARVEILAEESVGAAQRFEDASIDLVLLDGSHNFEDVRIDIKAWWPKVKPGGKMLFHDFRWESVRRAIEEADLPGHAPHLNVFVAEKRRV